MLSISPQNLCPRTRAPESATEASKVFFSGSPVVASSALASKVNFPSASLISPFQVHFASSPSPSNSASSNFFSAVILHVTLPVSFLASNSCSFPSRSPAIPATPFPSAPEFPSPLSTQFPIIKLFFIYSPC